MGTVEVSRIAEGETAAARIGVSAGTRCLAGEAGGEARALYALVRRQFNVQICIRCGDVVGSRASRKGD